MTDAIFNVEDFDPDKLTLEALRALPAPKFVERDPFELKRRYVQSFEAETGRTLYPAQTEMFVIEVMAYARSIMGDAIQSAFLQNRAIWAEGDHLDEVARNVSTFRLPATLATSQVRFTLSAARPVGVIVPVATRVAASDELVFSTTQEIIIPAGDMTGDVDVVALSEGANHNGLEPGQITDILDPVAYVASVVNILASGGGSDIEKDDRLRLRVVNAFERVSKAGPRAGYVENVKAVNSAIVDVSVVRTQPGYIQITPLMQDGTAPDVIDAAILEKLDPETTVPMGDYVSVEKAQRRGFAPTITVRVDGIAIDIQSNVNDVIVDQFADWSQILGARISPAAIIARIKVLSGVVDVQVADFEFTDLAATEFAGLDGVTLNIVEAPNV